MEKLYFQQHKIRDGKVKGIFLRNDSNISDSNIQKLKDNNITDIYTLTIPRTNDITQLEKVINLCSENEIKVHSWFATFKYDGSWNHTDEHKERIRKFVGKLLRVDGLEWICLDYIRYAGYRPTSSSYPANYSMINNFIKEIREIIDDEDYGIELSACVKAEETTDGSWSTKNVYGQDYVTLNNHLDYLMPMLYRHEYGWSSTQLYNHTKYIIDKTSEDKVVPIIQTYKNTTPLTKTTLEEDVNSVLKAGCKGYSLFRYGLINEYPSK